MMKINSLLILVFIPVIMISCENNNESAIYSISGKVQKGPFITGTTITLNELNPNLGQTGKSFTATTMADDGSFSLNNLELNTNLSLITANNFLSAFTTPPFAET